MMSKKKGVPAYYDMDWDYVRGGAPGLKLLNLDKLKNCSADSPSSRRG